MTTRQPSEDHVRALGTTVKERRLPYRRQRLAQRAGSARMTPAKLAGLCLLAAASTQAPGLASASATPAASIATKCKTGKKAHHCRKQKTTKPAKAKITLTNCPTADLTPGLPYTFTGRVAPARAGIAIVIQYFDQGTDPLAKHTVSTARDGTFRDTYAYPATGIRRGGTVRANSTTAIDPVCDVTIAEM